MKNLTAVLLSVLLAIPAWASDTIEAKARKITIGTQVEVKFKNHQPIRGQMGEVFPGGFAVKTYEDRKNEGQHVQFADVVSIKELDRHGNIKGLLYVITVVSAAAGAVAGVRSLAR